MDTHKRFQDWIHDRLPLFVLLLCIVQPVMDVAGYWQQTFGISNAVTMVLRMVLLGGSVLLGFLLCDRKRYYILTAVILFALTAGHIYACTRSANGYIEPVKDLVNLVRIYFLPLMTLCFITFLRKNEAVFPALIRGMVIDLFLIAGVQLFSALTGTDPHTYSVDKIGIRGWFLWTNSQSAILAMLAPIVIVWSVRRWKGKILPIILVTAVSEATLFVLAPRLAYASLAITGLGIAFCLLLFNRACWRQALAAALITCLFIAAFPISPTQSRLSVNEDRAVLTEKKIEKMNIQIEIVSEPETENEGKDGDPAAAPKPKVKLDKKNAAKLEKLYRSQDIIWSMVERFGRERVFQAYNYTLDPTVLSNTRLMKIRFCELLMLESGVASRLFGLNLAEMCFTRLDKNGNPHVDNYDVENDLHGIYFLTGIVGLAMMILFLLFFGVRALIAVIHWPRMYFTPKMGAFAIAYGLGLIHAYYTASVLRRNNASFYLAIVLAGLWYLSRRQTEKQTEACEQPACE